MLIGNGLGCWKTIVTRRRSALTSISWISSPSSVIRPARPAPAVISVRRLSERSSVVLPEPLAPISASTSPRRTGRRDVAHHPPLAVGERHGFDPHALARGVACVAGRAAPGGERAPGWRAAGEPAPLPEPSAGGVGGDHARVAVHGDAAHGWGDQGSMHLLEAECAHRLAVQPTVPSESPSAQARHQRVEAPARSSAARSRQRTPSGASCRRRWARSSRCSS